MKIFNYSPEKIEVEGEEPIVSPFDGIIKVEIPTYFERLELLKAMELGKTDEDNIDKALGMMKLVQKHVKSVDLKHKKTDEKITDLDELSYYREGSGIINEIGRLVVGGIPMGNG